MGKHKPTPTMPGDKENASINRGIKKDPDAREWTKDDFKRARPAAEILPGVTESRKQPRGPQKAPTKEIISIRLDKEVLAWFRRTGPGWQARINQVLSDYKQSGKDG